ncbi:MAG: nucleotidyltransferase family protein [Candidatus Woesearchaeota archaeon]
MKAIILAGGKGERLRPLTLTTPKHLIKINGKTLLEYQFSLLKKYGITEITLSVGYLAEKYKEYYKDGSKFGVDIDYVVEEEPLGTAGCLRLIKDKITKTTIVMNGDELRETNIDKLIAFHKQKNAIATIALKAVEDTSQFGVVEIENGQIKRFVEKPKPEDAPSNLINSGLYVVEPEIINYVKPGKCMFEFDIFPKLAEEGKLFGIEVVGKWFPTDTFERIKAAKRGWK